MLDQFARQNRWWVDPTEVDRDRHLWRLHEAARRWEPPLPFDFDRDATYTLHGPRQEALMLLDAPSLAPAHS